MLLRPFPRVLALLLALSITPSCKVFCPACPVKKYEPQDERFVFFAVGKTDVLPDGLYTIGYVVAQLDTDPSLHVLIIGHADQKGKSDANRELSLKRARVVRKALVDNGVKERRILMAAPREQSESTLEQLNRRADLFVFDPMLDEATKRVGYPIDIKTE